VATRQLLDPFVVKVGPWGYARAGVVAVTGWIPWRGRIWHRWAGVEAKVGDDLGEAPEVANPLHWLPQPFGTRPVCGSPTGRHTIEFEFLARSPAGCKRCIELGAGILLQHRANTR
jgi:hypothetical protein